MAHIFKISCDRCGYRPQLTERARQYQLPGGRTAIIEQTLAWCHACQRVVEAERLPAVSEIDQQIAEVSGGVECLAATGSTAKEEVRRLQERKEWRLARQTPPKCLECGSTCIEPFTQDQNGDWRTITHAGCEGRLRAAYVGPAAVREWPLPQYSPEGDFLSELLREDDWGMWTSPAEMLKHLEVSGKVSNRKLRLFACACCRRIWEVFSSEASRNAVEISEVYADRQVKSSVRQKAEEEARSAGRETSEPEEPWKMFAAYAAERTAAKSGWKAAFDTAELAKCAAACYMEPHSERGVDKRQARAAKESCSQCDLLADIIGPLPFRDIPIYPAWLSWNERTIVRLAQSIYDDRILPRGTLDKARLLILADALVEAGCTDQAILSHCRSPNDHVRGCWLIDLILGKS